MVANDVAPRGCDDATYGCKADDLPLSLIRSFHHPCSFVCRTVSAAVHEDSQISRPHRDVHLQPTFNALHHREEYGQDGQDQDPKRNPEGVPLRSVAPIVPELRQRARPGFVVYLFQDQKSIMPISEVVDLPFFSIQVPDPDESLIEPAGRFCNHFLVPLLGCGIVSGEQKFESP